MQAYFCRSISAKVQQRENPRALNEARGKSLCTDHSMRSYVLKKMHENFL